MLQAGQAREEVGRLRRIAQAFAHRVGQSPARLAQQARFAFVWRRQAQQAAHQRALAGTVAADEAHDGALGDRQVDAIKHAVAGGTPVVAAMEAQLAGLDGGNHGLSCSVD